MVPFQNPTIYISSLRVDEPITVLTDFLFVAICLYAYKQTKIIESKKFIYYYRLFFLAMAISTFISAIIGHAFLYHFGFNAKIYGWVTSMIGPTLAQIGSVYHVQKHIEKSKFKIFMYASILELIIMLGLLFICWTFLIVEIHSMLALLIMVTSLEIYNYKLTKSKTSLYIIIGIFTSVFAVLCHLLKLAVSVWFNHMDLSHIIMTLSLYLIYKGISYNDRSKKTLHSN